MGRVRSDRAEWAGRVVGSTVCKWRRTVALQQVLTYSTHMYMGVVVGAWSHTEDLAGCEGG